MAVPILVLAQVQSFLMMLVAQEMRPFSCLALLYPLEVITVATMKMLELFAQVGKPFA